MRHAMIMAGGSGTRMWPLSRKAKPKQLLPIIDGRSLLEIAAGRLEGLVEPKRRVICTAEKFRESIRASLPQFSDEQILGEPEGRDTVNAVGFTAAVLEKDNPKAVFAVLTADHLIEPEEEFRRLMDLGFRLVEADPSRLVTFAITPTYAATGFGYVERGEPISGFDGAYKAMRFVEKPNVHTAQAYLDTGTFGWNSGMFVFHAGTMMEIIKKLLPQTHTALHQIAAAWGTERQQAVLEDVYPRLQKISIDYAVMEPASRDPELSVCTIPMKVTWLDVGSYVSYAQTLKADSEGNRANTKTTLLGCTDVLAVSDEPGHTITALDCNDLIIVHTKDATLVCPKGSAEKIKELAGKVDARLQ